MINQKSPKMEVFMLVFFFFFSISRAVYVLLKKPSPSPMRRSYYYLLLLHSILLLLSAIVTYSKSNVNTQTIRVVSIWFNHLHKFAYYHLLLTFGWRFPLYLFPFHVIYCMCVYVYICNVCTCISVNDSGSDN